MRFLNFQLGNCHYGVPLTQVKEVVAFPELTSVPGSTKEFLGIMNLRDEILPVIDMRIKFGIEPTLTHDTSTIICDLDGKIVGIVVDMIHSVLSPLDSEVLGKDGAFGASNPVADLVLEIVQLEGKLILTLDMPQLIASNEADLKLLRNFQDKLAENSTRSAQKSAVPRSV